MSTVKVSYSKDDILEIINKLNYIKGYLVARSQADSAKVIDEIIETLTEKK